MRVLYFDWWKAATEYYRLYPLDYIDSSELTIIRSTEQKPDWKLMEQFDTIVISRGATPETLSIIKLAKKLHRRVIIDYDDDCLHLDQYNPMFGYYKQHKENIINCLILADEIWVSTEAVKQSFRLYNKNIHIIPNALNEYDFPVSKKKLFNNNKIATWRGGYSHEGDMYELGVPEKIINTVNSNPKWKFIMVGQRFLYYEKRCGDNYLAYTGNDNFVFFQNMMQQNNAALFFYPLSNTAFNRSKSNCSWIENTYCGSAFFGNTELPEFEKPGISDLKLMPKAISENHWKYMRDQNEKSWEYIQENLLLSKVNKIREERLCAV
jgi:hypothetical protein